MKRKLLGTAVVLLSSLALFACGGKKEDAKPAERHSIRKSVEEAVSFL